MDLRKLWDNVESTKYKSVCDVYGAEHLSRLLGTLRHKPPLPPPLSLL